MHVVHVLEVAWSYASHRAAGWWYGLLVISTLAERGPALQGISRRLAALVAMDIAGYSRLMGADEEGTLERLKADRAMLDAVGTKHHGRIVGGAGDGLLIEFPSVVNAIKFAIEVQTQVGERNAHLTEHDKMLYRIGINMGDVLIDNDDIYGDGVNIAARLEALAEPGGICISNAAHDQIRDRVDCLFADMGEIPVKNIARPVRVWRWRPDGQAPDVPVARPRPAPADRPALAVLPFTNMSDDPEQEYFADGIAEDIITSLSRLSQLLVIARNSSFTYKGKHAKAETIGEELGVRYMVQGSVRRVGSRVRISCQLIDCSSGGHVWAERFDRELADIFAVQDEVTQKIVDSMAVKLSVDDRRRLGHRGTDNLAAYDHFLRGLEQYRLQTKDNILKVKAIFEHAAELDPQFAPAYAFLSFIHLMDHINSWNMTGHFPLERAHEHASQALALDEAYPQAHVAMGSVLLWKRQYGRAAAEFERAIALDPNFATGHVRLGWVLHYAGRAEEAVELIERGMRLDPHYPDDYLHMLAQANFQLARYERAIDLLRRRIVLNPDTDISRVLLAASYGYAGRTAEARAEWANLLRINPDYSLEHGRQVMPYKDPAGFQRIIDGLQMAGLPD